MKQNIRTLAAIMICGIALAACSDKDSDDNTNIVNPATDTDNVETVCTPSLPQSCTLTITATKGNDASLSKALSLTNDDKTLNASWKKDEKVAVYNGEDKIGELTAQSDGASTTLSGDNLSPAPTVGATLTLKFNETDYSGQVGTLETIASTYDYATATVTVKSVSADGNITIEESTAEFENQQAIVKFTLSSDGTAINATSLKVNDLTINLASAKKEVFVAIPAETKAVPKDITLTVYDGTFSYTYTKSSATIAAGKYYTINVKSLVQSTTIDLSTVSKNSEIPNGFVLTGTLSGNHKISIAPGATVTLNNVTIEGEDNNSYNWAGITCDGDATIILEGDNTVKGFYKNYPGIYIAEGKTLTINGTGTLNASSNGWGAGIGDIFAKSCGNIIINGGTVTATGGKYSAGIGGSRNATCGNITINGGTITATGGLYAAGIGSGDNYSTCGKITISGGEVTATGSSYAAGIGSGYTATCEAITISGGTVTAIGGVSCAGIGSGYYQSSCGNITITAGVEKVTATKGQDAPNSIGAGYNSTCGTVTIEEGANVIQN
ncbi:MAG: hypothetical protein IKQ30_01805 [Bacteroidales bacterium]|nr:hypothetical protein [Bacteroidales bacterium]